MKVHVQAVNFNVDKDLVELIEKKITSLLKFYDHIIEANVFLKVQKTSEGNGDFRYPDNPWRYTRPDYLPQGRKKFDVS